MRILLLISIVSSSIYTPEQIHIAWTADASSMSVTWAAESISPGASVQYTPVLSHDQIVKTYNYSSIGIWKTFANTPEPKILQRHLNVCKATMPNLVQGGLYAYRVGSTAYGWSLQYSFQAKRNFASDETTRFLVYGDLSAGEDIIPTVASLLEEVHTHEYDAIIHNGDFAYNLDTDHGMRGDYFMQSIEPVASRLPYMVAQGNHESWFSILHYINRFEMPGNTSNLWYSFNAGRVHFIAYNTEPVFDYFIDMQVEMMRFIENDLETYDREQYPWLVVFGHRPLYCSANLTSGVYGGQRIRNNANCLQEADRMRLFFEDVWYNHGVDLVISSHVHAYERLGPVYRNVSVPCQEQSYHTCVNAKAPVYVVTGVPGNSESIAPVSPTPLPFSWAQDDHLGFSRLTVFNGTHLLWEQVHSLTFEVSDHLWLIKQNTLSFEQENVIES